MSLPKRAFWWIPGMVVVVALVGGSARAGSIYAFGGQEQFSRYQYNLCLSIKTGGTRIAAGDPLVSTWCDGKPHQDLVLTRGGYSVQGSWYSFLISTPDGQLCAQTTPTSATMQPCNASAISQNFIFQGGGIFSGGGSGCLDVLNGNTSPNGGNASLDVTTCNGSLAQSFWPSGARFQISAGNNQCLSFEGGQPILLPCESLEAVGGDQTWWLGESGTISLDQAAQNKCLVLDTVLFPNNLDVTTCTGRNSTWSIGAQEWDTAVDAASTAYLQSQGSFVPPGSVWGVQPCLDVNGNQKQSGRSVDAWVCGGPAFGNSLNTAQVWTLNFLP